MHIRSALATKKVTISCAFTAGSLHVDVVETHTYFDPAVAPMHQAFWRPRTNFLDYFKFTLADFSRIKHNSNAADDLCKTYVIFSKRAVIEDEIRHQCNELGLRLPADTRQLLILLGTLDRLLQHIKYHDHTDGFDINFYYHGRCLSHDKLIISRQITEWMLKTIKENELELQRYQGIVPSLAQLLETETRSLAPAILQQLFPKNSLLADINKKVTHSQHQALFNPEASYPPKVQSMLVWLRETLHAKSPKNALNEVHDKKIHDNIAENFKQLSVHQTFIWALMISSLNGEFAPDGGLYNEVYSEICLLMEATRALNKQGLMTLNYQDSKTYLNFYRKKVNNEYEIDPSVLGQELSIACGYLKFEFEHAQAFHPGPAIFNQAATSEFKRLGLHWNDQYGKKLLKYGMLFRAMERSTTLPPVLITKILRINDDTLPQEEVMALASKVRLR